jgi:endonuclease/exonuclease/phosphatase family metal-dependent hydrolase
MIKNDIKPHIHNILTQPGGAIAIDLFFKHDYKFRIISVYLSSTNTANRKLTQDTAITWMQQAISSNLYPIILGDFNADNSTSTSSTTKFQLLNYLHSTNMYDLADYTDNLQNTWHSSRYQTKIDYIWAHDALIPHLHEFKLDNSSSSTNSDHQILTSTWVFPFATTKIRHKSKSK